MIHFNGFFVNVLCNNSVNYILLTDFFDCARLVSRNAHLPVLGMINFVLRNGFDLFLNLMKTISVPFPVAQAHIIEKLNPFHSHGKLLRNDWKRVCSICVWNNEWKMVGSRDRIHPLCFNQHSMPTDSTTIFWYFEYFTRIFFTNCRQFSYGNMIFSKVFRILRSFNLWCLKGFQLHSAYQRICSATKLDLCRTLKHFYCCSTHAYTRQTLPEINENVTKV